MNGWPDAPQVNLHFGPRPTVVVEKQDGRAFSGYVNGADNSHIPFVGVIKRSGRSSVGSVNSGILSGDIGRNDIEWCWTDKTQNFAEAACNVLKKQGGK